MERTKHIGDKTETIKERWMARRSSWEGRAWHRRASAGIGNRKGNHKSKKPEEKDKYMRCGRIEFQKEERGKPVGWAV